MRRGFSFIEVMFAVMVLGIGFILIAGMFPITIMQTQETLDDSVGASVARGAAIVLQVLASEETMPATNGTVVGFNESSPAGIAGELICTTNRRFGWVPMYRRNAGDRFAQVFIVATRVRNQSEYVQADVESSPEDTTGSPSNLSPRIVYVSLKKGTDGLGGRVQFHGDGGGGSSGAASLMPAGDPNPAAAEGTYLIIANDGDTGRANGRVYQLGSSVEGQRDTFQLAPGGDMQNSTEDVENARALIVGRGYLDPTRPGDGFGGPAQDVAIYTTFVRLK